MLCLNQYVTTTRGLPWPPQVNPLFSPHLALLSRSLFLSFLLLVIFDVFVCSFSVLSSTRQTISLPWTGVMWVSWWQSIHAKHSGLYPIVTQILVRQTQPRSWRPVQTGRLLSKSSETQSSLPTPEQYTVESLHPTPQALAQQIN